MNGESIFQNTAKLYFEVSEMQLPLPEEWPLRYQVQGINPTSPQMLQVQLGFTGLCFIF